MTKPKAKPTAGLNTKQNSQINLDDTFARQQRISLWDSVCMNQLQQGKDVREATEIATAVISHRDGQFGVPKK